MAKIILFSDLHAHPFKPYATILPNGMNSRLADAIHCIAQVHHHAVNVGADLVLFGGDMFHVRKTISVAAFNAVYEQMAKFAVDKIPTVLIHGNHDQADKAGEQYSVYAFQSFLTVVDKPGWVVVQGAERRQEYAILAVPYMEDIEHLRSIVAEPGPAGLHRIFLGHLGLQGAVIGADFVYSNPHDPKIEDLRPEEYDALFLGHFHRHQQVSARGWYIGAPLHHNWGDRHEAVRGCLLYDTETRTIEQLPLRAPQFVELTVDQMIEADEHGAPACVEDSFVRVVTDTPVTESTREAWRKHLAARTLEIVPTRKKSSAEESVPRLQVDPAMSIEQLLEKYVHSGVVSVDGLDDNYLLQIGHEVLQEVEESDV